MKPVRRPRLSLASQILVFQLAIVLGALIIGAAASYLNESRQLDQRYEKRSLTIAQSVAGMPSVGDGLRDSDPSRTLQPLDRKSTRLNSSHANISYAGFCLK